MKLSREWVMDRDGWWKLYPVGKTGFGFLAQIDPKDNCAAVYADLHDNKGTCFGSHATLGDAKAACLAWLRGHGHEVDGEPTVADMVDRIRRLEEAVELLVRRQVIRQEDWK